LHSLIVVEFTRKGELVGFPDDETPIMIQLEGRHDILEFWMQSEALGLLQGQMLAAVSDGLPPPEPVPEPALPPRAPAPAKGSFFGRKQSKTAEPAPLPPKRMELVKAPVTVEVQLDDVHFRTENDFGLYETLRGRAVILTVEAR
jgi:hypothetical protein